MRHCKQALANGAVHVGNQHDAHLAQRKTGRIIEDMTMHHFELMSVGQSEEAEQ